MIWLTLYLYFAGIVIFCMLGDRIVPKDDQIKFAKLTGVLWPIVVAAGILYDIYCWLRGDWE